MEIIKDWHLLNGLTLAYMGDGIYELYIRQHVLRTGKTKPNILHREATRYVSAKAQANLIQQMLDNESFLTEEELEYFKRGRNAKSHTKAKNADVITYRMSTGFEAMIGYLYLSGQNERLEEVIVYSTSGGKTWLDKKEIRIEEKEVNQRDSKKRLKHLVQNIHRKVLQMSKSLQILYMDVMQ